jgi:Methyltransferase domain
VTTLAALLDRLVEPGTFTGATLSRPRRADPSTAQRITADPVLVKGRLRIRIRRHLGESTSDRVLDPPDAARLLDGLFRDYRQGLLHFTDADFQVLAGGKADPKVLERPATRPEQRLGHDRAKQRVIPETSAAPFLVALGVQTMDGKVRAQRQDKFRQVNRFCELVEHVLPKLPVGPLRVVDFGSGRSYLTFALHHLLTSVHGREVDILGLDLKADVVAECEHLARRIDAVGLRFEVGDIAQYDVPGEIDLVVSLHACDTATDAALDRAVRWAAKAIMAVPCCQHELSRQLDNAALRPLLRRGTLRERFAADVTDAARARLLELVGYDVDVVEFVPLEHTPKNILLRATRTERPAADTARLAAEYRAFVGALAVSPSLERMLSELLPGEVVQ